MSLAKFSFIKEIIEKEGLVFDKKYINVYYKVYTYDIPNINLCFMFCFDYKYEIDYKYCKGNFNIKYLLPGIKYNTKFIITKNNKLYELELKDMKLNLLLETNINNELIKIKDYFFIISHIGNTLIINKLLYIGGKLINTLTLTINNIESFKMLYDVFIAAKSNIKLEDRNINQYLLINIEKSLTLYIEKDYYNVVNSGNSYFVGNHIILFNDNLKRLFTVDIDNNLSEIEDYDDMEILPEITYVNSEDPELITLYYGKNQIMLLNKYKV